MGFSALPLQQHLNRRKQSALPRLGRGNKKQARVQSAGEGWGKQVKRAKENVERLSTPMDLLDSSTWHRFQKMAFLCVMSYVTTVMVVISDEDSWPLYK